MRSPRLVIAGVIAIAALSACATTDDSGSAGTDARAVEVEDGTPADTLRLGFFGNVTHSPALIGVEKGFIADALGGETALETTVFNAGPAAVEALFAGAIDASYIGPNPAINAFVKSNGDAVRIVSGATSGGAQLVVRDTITSAADLKGATLSTPQLGNTQDVALRAWLADEGLSTDTQGGGDVSIVPQENAQTLDQFKAGAIDGAWLPEPWASRLVDAGATVLVDEKDLWPDGEFVTTHIIVATQYLADHPQTVKALLEGHIEAVDYINDDPARAQPEVNAAIEKYAGKPLAAGIIARAFENLTFTFDPIASTLQQSADDAAAVGLTDPADLAGIYDLRILNALLRDNGDEPVSTAGLGEQ
ncbi:MAG: ABC transporter substrate-binding protein [Candidatus Nanopelagicales bacterium]